MAHAPPLNAWSIGAMSSVLIIYALLKSPLKYAAADAKLSPKADAAYRSAAQEWINKNN